MRANKIYLEASGRTQDLLNIKWALRSAGYHIASTWHEDNGASTAEDHWNRSSLEALQLCDSLLVICAPSSPVRPEFAMMAGFALARGISVYWVGQRIGGLCDFRAVQQFDTAEEFRKQILLSPQAEAASMPDRLAA